MKMTLSKSLIIFVLTSTLLFSVIALMTYRQYGDGIRDQELDHTNKTLDLTASRIHAQISDITEDMFRLAAEPVFKEFSRMSPSQRFQVKEYLHIILNCFSRYHPGVISIKLHSPNQNGIYSEANFSTLSAASLVVAYRDIAKKYNLETFLENIVITPPFVYDNRKIFGIVAPIATPKIPYNGKSYHGCLIVICDFNIFSQAIDFTSPAVAVTFGQTILVSNNHDIKYMIEKGYPEQDHRLLVREILDSEMKVFAMSPLEGESRQEKALWRYFVSMVILLLVLQFLLTLALRKRIIRPIENIAQQTQQIDIVMRGIQNPDTSRNELEVLIAGMNGMVQHVKKLSQETAEAENKYLRERVMFLQTQINPHFLYNNLECIRGMAYTQNIEGVARMASTMAHIYRYCVRNTSLVTLMDELECLKQFMEIIAIRYGDSFILKTSIAKETLSMRMPSMILQPLAENAIQHGFLHAGKKEGQLNIKSYVDSHGLHIEMEDDGIGMTERQIQEINERRQPTNLLRPQIGISNIQNRIAIICDQGSYLLYKKQSTGKLLAHIFIKVTVDDN